MEHIRWPQATTCAASRWRWRARASIRISIARPSVARIYVTLAADGRSANCKFTPDEQEFEFDDAGSLRAPRQWLGAARLGCRHACQADLADPKGALAMAWAHAKGKPRRR